MAELSEAERRKAILTRVLEDEIAFSRSRALMNHSASLALMLSALGCTIAASILGISGIAPTQLVGSIAALPALFAYTAIALKLEGKSSWNKRKYVKLRVLLSRLNFELSDPITVEEVKAISNERNIFNEDMDAEWNRELTLDFLGIGKKK